MTVKELIEVLQACDENAPVRIETRSEEWTLQDDCIYQQFNPHTNEHEVRLAYPLDK